MAIQGPVTIGERVFCTDYCRWGVVVERRKDGTLAVQFDDGSGVVVGFPDIQRKRTSITRTVTRFS